MLTDAQIEQAIQSLKLKDALHEHNDCVRIAYAWLDAQVNTQGATRTTRPLKHLIEKWGGRYVSQSDVEVAAHLHPKIRGKYPHYNISSRLTEPSTERLTGVSEAFTQDYRSGHAPKNYKIHE
ncbi:hypothetical protein [Variovorax sp. HJSM1_2]|uniref:hypothetical protein n=1 Tax=Variovorax sp. HJSM1_2 TaxID=3366263 RepID=UPI003BCDE44C